MQRFNALGILILLVCSSVWAMEKNTALPQPAKVEQQTYIDALLDCFEIESLLLALPKLLVQARKPGFKYKKLFTLLQYIDCIKMQKLIGTRSPPFNRYCQLEELQKYLLNGIEDGDVVESAQQFKLALTKGFHLAAWETVLGCKNLEAILYLIHDLSTFQGPYQEKALKLKQLKELLASSLEHNPESTDENPNRGFILDYFENTQIDALLDELIIRSHLRAFQKSLKGHTSQQHAPALSKHDIYSLLDAVIAGKQVDIPLILNFAELEERLDHKIEEYSKHSEERIRDMLSAALRKISHSHQEIVEDYVHSDLLFTFFTRLIRADTPQQIPPWTSLTGSLRWDTILEFVGDRYGYIWSRTMLDGKGNEIEVKVLFGLWFVDKLKQLIRNFQAGEPQFTSEKLRSAFTMNLESQINMNTLAHVLNRWQQGQNADAWDTLNVENVERYLTVDLRNALNPYIPERVQIGKHYHVYQQLYDTRAYESLRNGLTYLCGPIILWLFLRTFCATAMDWIEPRGLVAAPLLIGVTTLFLIVNDFFARPSLKTTVVANTIFSQLSFKAHSYYRKIRRPEDIAAYVKDEDPHATLFRALLKLLSQEHLTLLHNPYTLIELLEDPLTFVRTHAYEPFIYGLCTIDKNYAEQRMEYIFRMLGATLSADDIPYAKAYESFADKVDAELLDTLPCPALLLVALYNPDLLLGCIPFIRPLGQRAVEPGGTLLDLLCSAAEQAQATPPTQPPKVLSLHETPYNHDTRSYQREEQDNGT